MKLTLKQIRKAVLTIVLVLVSAGFGYWWGTHQVQTQKSKLKTQNWAIVNKLAPRDKNIDFSLFWRVWDKLEEKYLEKDKIDEQKMFYGAIQGMTQSLGDPYTVFLPPSENKQVQEDLNGSFEGVGLRLGFNKDKRLVVMAPLKGTPAEKAGVRPGDLILQIKDNEKKIDENATTLTLPEVVEKIRGPQGTLVTLTLLHEGDTDSYTVDIIRQTIVVPSVEVEFLQDGQIAHLKLLRFGDLTDQQWDQSVGLIINQGAKIKGLVLDVRGNAGGYLSGAVNLASEFLSKGVILKQENYQGEIESYSVNRKGGLLEIPMVVLIDRGSASASEILAGALLDHQRAKLVGETTFGKGTIQESEDIDGGAGLHITTAKWLTPNGVWVNDKGLSPEFEVKNDPEKPDDDLQLKKALEVLTSAR